MKNTYIFIAAVLSLGIFLGFSNSDNLTVSKTKTNPSSIVETPVITSTDINNPVSTNGFEVYYSDKFTAPNDTIALRNRGYRTYRNGTFSGEPVTPIWFTGNPFTFPALNGLPADYVASNFQSAGILGNIDNWLVLPDLDVVAGDTISFFSKARPGSPFPDSIRVMYNPTNNTLPSDPNWVELGRFKVNTAGVWEKRSFAAPTTDNSARFAIRHSVVNGGRSGANSDYIGIDSLVVRGNGVLPVELSGFASVITNNNVDLNWSTSNEINNSGFDIERSSNGNWSKIGFVNGNGTSSSPNYYTFADNNLSSGTYGYRLKQIDFNGNFEYFNLSNEVVIGIPKKFSLSQNYPNPFNPSTTINYEIPVANHVAIIVYDIMGKEVATLVNQLQDAGYYSVTLDGSNFASGQYFYKLQAGDFSQVNRMILLK